MTAGLKLSTWDDTRQVGSLPVQVKWLQELREEGFRCKLLAAKHSGPGGWVTRANTRGLRGPEQGTEKSLWLL